MGLSVSIFVSMTYWLRYENGIRIIHLLTGRAMNKKYKLVDEALWADSRVATNSRYSYGYRMVKRRHAKGLQKMAEYLEDRGYRYNPYRWPSNPREWPFNR